MTMFKRVSAVLMVVSLLVFLVALPSFAWRFVSVADSRGSTNGVNTAELTKIIGQINTEGADLVLFAGDAITGSSNDATMSSQFDNWLSVMSGLNTPWYYTPGNHEIQSANQENIIRSKVDMPLNGPAGYEETVFSFDHQNAHFVFLNSDHYGQQHRVQTSWLASDLAQTTQDQVFVIAHDPAYPAGPHIGSSLDAYPAERDAFWNTMTDGRVGMYFCGHEHLYQRSTHGDIYQVINGTCGAPIAYGYPNTVAQYQYVVVDVNGYNVQAVAKDDNGVVFDSWSYTVTPVPEPSSLVALAGGLSMLMGLRRRFRR